MARTNLTKLHQKIVDCMGSRLASKLKLKENQILFDNSRYLYLQNIHTDRIIDRYSTNDFGVKESIRIGNFSFKIDETFNLFHLVFEEYLDPIN